MDSLTFSQKASAANLNYEISDFTLMPKTGHCQFADCDVEPNSPTCKLYSFVEEQWKENFDIFPSLLPQKNGTYMCTSSSSSYLGPL